jgi:hypothetical protein
VGGSHPSKIWKTLSLQKASRFQEDLHGFSLNVHCGWDARSGRPTQAGRHLGQIAATVPNGTVLLRALEHHVSMSKMKAKEESDKTLLSNVKKEMAKPRMAKSARGESESSRCANRAGQLAGVLASEEQL